MAFSSRFTLYICLLAVVFNHKISQTFSNAFCVIIRNDDIFTIENNKMGSTPFTKKAK